VVAILRAACARDYLPVCEVLVEAGVTALELTLTTPGTIAQLPELVERLPSATFGVGTVLTAKDAAAAADAGAGFLVTPAVSPAVAQVATARGLALVGGALSPTEAHSTWSSGAAAVKVFPAQTVGPAYLRHLAGPFPDMRFLPSGGVRMQDIAAWIGAGALAVGLGGPLLGDALDGGDLQALATRARSALAEVTTARDSAS